MLKFRFAGNLRRYYGPLQLDVKTPSQGLRLLLAQNHGFKRAFLNSQVKLKIGGKVVVNEFAPAKMDQEYPDGTEIYIAPVVKGGITGTILTWIAVSVSVLAIGFSIYMSRNMKTKTSAESAQDGTIDNNTYTSAENRVGQGKPIPILLGEMVCGSNVISLGIDTSNNKDWHESVS